MRRGVFFPDFVICRWTAPMTYHTLFILSFLSRLGFVVAGLYAHGLLGMTDHQSINPQTICYKPGKNNVSNIHASLAPLANR